MRLIDADALKAFIRNKYFQCDMPEEWGNGVMWATSQINRYCTKVAPSIDIVFCKECRHWIGETEYYEDREYKACWQLCGQYMNSEFWCKYGEREGE